MSICLQKQSGHAAILFVLLAPMLFGMFTLASDGARAMQNKARVNDAIEVAGLVLAANNSSVTEQEREILAGKYIQQYLSGSDSIAENGINVTRKINEPQSGCSGNDCNRYIEYKLNVKTKHIPWFGGSDSIASFDDPYNVAGTAEVRKYQAEAVDVVFVADFSGSMKDIWSGSSLPLDLNNTKCNNRTKKCKITDLFEIIEKVTGELSFFNQSNDNKNNSVGLVPFNFYTYDDQLKCYISQLTRDQQPTLSYNRALNNEKLKHIVNNMFTIKNEDYCIYNDVQGSDFNFKNINLTSTDDDIGFEDFNKTVIEMSANGGTTSYQGIIRGAQMLSSQGGNNRRILIILSDGEDWGNESSNHEKLVNNYNMCNLIREKLKVGKPEGNIQSRLAMIGFDYDISNNRAIRDCVGEDNVFKAENTNEILNTILELISEEVGRLK